MTLRDKAAIVGLGTTEFSKNSGRSEYQLALEAVTAALDDAGIAAEEVDGLCTYTMDNSTEAEVLRGIGGRALRFFSRVHFGGGGACAPFLQAAMAVASGVAEVVVCYRAMNERSGQRFGSPVKAIPLPETELMGIAYHAFHGLQTAAAKMGICMRRYMHETGATNDDFAELAVTTRAHAATNPRAFFYGRPITKADYFDSRMIADPFRLFDVCQESDGAVAFVVTGAARASTLRGRPVAIRAAAQAAPVNVYNLSPYYKADIVPREECAQVAAQLYRMAGLGPAEIDVAIIYDHFGPTVLPALEGYGFCRTGEARHFIRDGNIGLGGALPVNTHGGQVGEAYIHGMNGIAEAVRQLRGTAANQVLSVEHVLVTAGTGVPTSGLILGH